MDDGSRPDLSTAEGDYRKLFEQSAIPVALVYVRGAPHVATASRGFLDTFDLRRSAVVGLPLNELVPPEGRAELNLAMYRCLATSETLRVKIELRAGAGRRCVGLAVHSARAPGFADHVVLEAEGRGYVVDASGQRLTSLLAQGDGRGQSMTYLHDLRNHRIRYVDGGLARRMGLSEGVLHFKDFQARLHPDDLASHPDYEGLRTRLSDEEFLVTTARLRDREGEWRLINFRSRVFRRGRDGAARFMLGSATDITEYAAAAVEAAGVSVQRAEENERARIGRELHDSTSQYLVAADLGLAQVLQSRELSAADRERLLGVQVSLATAQTEMRAFAYFLHPPELRELGLLRTMEKFCAGFARRSGLAIAFASADVPEDLSSEAEHALFRVCQEALMNVYRHAFARAVSVSLEARNGHLVLEVRDDGVGVDGVDRFEHGGIGVAGMKSRMLSIGGELSLDYLGPGLAVVARLPWPS